MNDLWTGFRGWFWKSFSALVLLQYGVLVLAMYLAAWLVGCGDPFTADLFGDATDVAGVGGAGVGGADAQTSASGAAGGGDEAASSGVGAGSDVGGTVSGVGGGGAPSSNSAGGADPGAGGSPPSCGPATCVGCCDASGTCQQGALDVECGAQGAACVACPEVCGWAPAGQGMTCPGVQQEHCVAGSCKKPPDYIEGWCCPVGQYCGAQGEPGVCAAP